jgi:uncharacterized cupin superfamily protein
MALKDIQPFSRSELFGGKGRVDIWNLLGREEASPFSAVLWCALEPGGSVGVHRQQVDPEIVVCISGQGQAKVGGTLLPLEPGALAYLPHGESLALRNRGEEPLVYLIVKAKDSA